MTLKYAELALRYSALTILASTFAGASIIQIDQSAFLPGSGTITFSEVPLGTNNPVYTPTVYGGSSNEPTVTFGGYFVGQSIGDATTCTNGQEVSGCVVGSPTGPLTLDAASPATFIANDSADPTSPALSGDTIVQWPGQYGFQRSGRGCRFVGRLLRCAQQHRYNSI